MSTRWVKAASLADLPEDEMLGVDLDGSLVALYNIGGRIHATSNICTHAFALLTDGFLDDDIIECPLHAGRFSIRTGEALGPPVKSPIKVYPVKIEGDDVLVDLG